MSTYKLFFEHLADELGIDAQLAEVCEDAAADPVFGSDEEKALVKAIKHAFPDCHHTFCSRHVEENVRRQLTNLNILDSNKRKIIDLLLRCLEADADDSRSIEESIGSLMQEVRACDDRVERYFTEYI